jgi:hypothetical protein
VVAAAAPAVLPDSRHLTNHGRDWVIVKLQFRVPYETDLTR